MTIDVDVTHETSDVAVVLDERDHSWVVSPPRGHWWLKLRRVAATFRDPSVAIPAGMLALIVGGCFLGPMIAHLPDPNVGSLSEGFLPMGSRGHLLGTNEFGNDELSRLLYGGRISILVGLGATSIGFAVGTALGMAAGYFGRYVDAFVMRIMDVLLAFPSLVLAMAVAASLGPSVRSTVFSICFYAIGVYARLARNQVLGVRGRDFVTAARSSGVHPLKIIHGHILPNILPPLLAYAMVTVGVAMLLEASLSYLGLGIRPPHPTWGNMIINAQTTMTDHPWLLVLPSLFLLVTVMTLNLVADAVRRRLALNA